jgi:hypothetical protein
MFNKAIELNSQFGTAYLNRGSMKESSGDLQGAYADWKIAAQLGIKQAGEYLGEYK